MSNRTTRRNRNVIEGNVIEGNVPLGDVADGPVVSQEHGFPAEWAGADTPPPASDTLVGGPGDGPEAAQAQSRELVAHFATFTLDVQAWAIDQIETRAAKEAEDETRRAKLAELKALKEGIERELKGLVGGKARKPRAEGGGGDETPGPGSAAGTRYATLEGITPTQFCVWAGVQGWDHKRVRRVLEAYGCSSYTPSNTYMSRGKKGEAKCPELSADQIAAFDRIA